MPPPAVSRAAPLLLLAALLTGCGSSHRAAAPPQTVATTKAPAAPREAAVRAPLRVVASRTGSLAAPVQDAVGAPLRGGGALVAGGLTAADTSTDAVLRVSPGGGRALGRLPLAVHDSAAALLGGAVYLFGGGSFHEVDGIVRVDPETGAARTVGRLPAPSSDQAAAAVGGTAYVVGGYDGTRWLDTVVAWRPGSAPHVVAHLPYGVRYAAVAAVGSRILIAGGSLADGTATDAVLSFTPATGRVRRIGRLPAPTTHAAAAALGPTVIVVGGRGAAVDTPTDRIVAVDPATGRARVAGRLDGPLSDLAAFPTARGVLLVGGHGRHGTVSTLQLLRAGPARPPAHARRAAAYRVPALVDTRNVYAADGTNMLSPAVRGVPYRIYVPNSESDTVDVIDPHTFRIVRHFAVGALPQHVTPAYDLKTLYVLNDRGNSLTPIDPRTSRPGTPIPVDDPYNMYFTPDGRYAIVVAERNARLDFRDAHTFRLHRQLHVPCRGVDHMDFTANGRLLLASCEFSGQMVVVDVARERVVKTLTLPNGSRGMPQDVKLSPDGKVFYVADMMANGLWEISARTFRVIGFLHTGAGAHGLYPSRDAKLLYVSNRGEGSISVVSFRARKVVAIWRLPGGGSPDMGGVSPDGKVLWLSGRYNSEVYAISTVSGRLLARIPVGSSPHGLCVWPQPGRYSLGHTGILR